VKLTQTAAVVTMLLALAGCAERELILPGERLDPRAVLDPAATADAGPAQATRAVPVSLPPVVANADWTHRGGSTTHRIGNPALGAAPALVWSAGIGAGDSRKNRITADPIVAGGRIFTLDADATVAATGTNGARLWATDLTPAADRTGEASGGGIAYGEGLVFVTTGFGELVALNPDNGAIAWRQKFDAAVGGAPAVSGGLVYVVARDASAWAVSARDGRVQWQVPGTPAAAGVMGVSSPAIDDRQVIFPFAGGQMTAVLKDSGVPVWTAYVAGQRLGRAYASVSDLTGDPVIAGNTIYAGTSAGRLAAVDATTGAALWSAGEGAVSPVAVAGNALFLVSDENQLLRIDPADGSTVWAVDLPLFVKDRDKRRKAIFAHYGPVLAGGRLVVASTDGYVRFFDPASGAVLSALPLPGGAASAPVVAGGTLYVVSKNGTLLAFR
jgi:outer membrane protein assembly factor BamB